jgi:hypothetical protein
MEFNGRSSSICQRVEVVFQLLWWVVFGWVGKNKIKANSAPLELELGLSLAKL